MVSLSNPDCTLALLTLEEDWELIERSRLLGFSAFISKRSELSEIISTVRVLLTDTKHFYLRVPQMPLHSENTQQCSTPLTKTELEILSELSDGSSTKEIALRRCNSEATIKSHLTSIYRKLGARNRIEALIAAGELHLLKN